MEKKDARASYEHEIQQNLKRNTVLSFADGAIFSFAMGMAPIGTTIVYYVGNFTDSKVIIGLLTTLYNLMFYTPQIFLAKKLQKLDYYKPLSLTLGILMRIVWLILGILTFLLGKSNPTLYLVLFYILLSFLGIVSGFNSDVWLVLTSRIVPANRFSDFLSWRSSLCGILEFTGAIISGAILSLSTFPDNYGILFIVMFAISMVSWFLYTKLLEPKNIIKKTAKLDNNTYFKDTIGILKKDKNFSIYLASNALTGGLGKMSLVFQIIYAKDKLAITTQEAVFVSTILLIMQTVGYILWGIVVKRKGIKIAGDISVLLFIPAILLTLWMPNVYILYLAVACMGLAQSYKNSNENKLLIDLSPSEEELPNYIGLRNTLLGPFFSFNSLIAGLILDATNFAFLTILSVVFMTIGILLFIFKLNVRENI